MVSRSIRLLLCCIVSVFMLFCCCACAQNTARVSFETDTAPEEIVDVITRYFSAAQGDDAEQVMELLFFMDNFDSDAYYRSFENGIKPSAATVYSVDKINDRLYAATLYVEVADSETQSGEVYNYIAKIDGNWRYILAKSNIPEDVLGDADLSAYSYTDERHLTSEDIIK